VARPTKLAWIVTSTDEATGCITVRYPRAGNPGRDFLELEWRGNGRLPAVGTVVRSFVALEPYDPKWKLASWLRALRRHMPAAKRMTLDRARRVLTAAHEDAAKWIEGTWTTTDLTTILQLFASAEGSAGQGHWLYAEDWRWSRERTSAAFARMLELPPDSVRPRPPDDGEPLSDYAERWNEVAEARDCERRLYLLGPHGDDHVFAALTPLEHEILVYEGLVRPRG
jgi:hypothetical protein